MSYQQLKNKNIMETKFICWDAGCGIYDIDRYSAEIKWHNDADVFHGTLAECLREKESKEIEVYRYNNCLPHLSNC